MMPAEIPATCHAAIAAAAPPKPAADAKYGAAAHDIMRERVCAARIRAGLTLQDVARRLG